jgi:NAD(P)-dependent dehydrogenase (short-subunit alcohol dehydrogenase family)
MMSDNGRVLYQRIAIITGAGRGLGRAIALALGAAGASVALAARNKQEVEETAELLREKGSPAFAMSVDMSVWQSVQSFVDHVLQEMGGVHILVNNAGIQGPIGPLVDNSVESWLNTVQVDLIGVFHGCKAVLPHMMRQRSGKIINLSGGGATAARPNYSAYAASKAAVIRLTETLAEEVKEYGIQVNALAPGAMNTQMLTVTLAAGESAGKHALEEAQQQLETGGTPLDLPAALAVYLASEASDGLTGKLISAPHDGWQTWQAEQIAEWMSKPWFTLRRIDPFTLEQFKI